ADSRAYAEVDVKTSDEVFRDCPLPMPVLEVTQTLKMLLGSSSGGNSPYFQELVSGRTFEQCLNNRFCGRMGCHCNRGTFPGNTFVLRDYHREPPRNEESLFLGPYQLLLQNHSEWLDCVHRVSTAVNNAGVALCLKYGESSFLFAADIDSSVEQEMIMDRLLPDV